MICKVCGQDKDVNEFYVDKKGYRQKTCKKCVIQRSRENQLKRKEYRKSYCREYHKANAEKRRQSDSQYKAKINALKTPCVKCGESRLYVIDFHHIDPKTKAFNINRKTAKTNFEIIKKETSKCVSLCRNCHAEFHYLYGVIPNDPIKALKEYLGGKNEEAK